MLNQVVIVGRLAASPEIRETCHGNKVSTIVLEVDRNFKSSDGVYETDFIPCTLWRGIAETTAQYCEAGSLVGVKGRLQSRSYETKDGAKMFQSELIAEKVTFLGYQGQAKKE